MILKSSDFSPRIEIHMYLHIRNTRSQLFDKLQQIKIGMVSLKENNTS